VQITKFQRRALLRAKDLRDKPFPIVGSMLRSWKVYLVLGAVIGGYSWLTWSIGVIEASIAALGFFVGLLIRDITWLRISARMWPINVEITDWSKVDKLLDDQAET
jgi:hypothetical protein